jgi:hypothetical protein
MSQKNAAGLQLAMWEIIGGSSFKIIGKDYHASDMLAALKTYTGRGADLIALTGPGQDYVVQRPPGQGGEQNPTPTPTPHSTPTPTPRPTPTPTPRPTPTPSPRPTPTPTPPSTPTPPPKPTPTPTMPPHGTPPPTPPPNSVPDSGATLPLFAVAILMLLVMNTLCLPALAGARRMQRKNVSSHRP